MSKLIPLTQGKFAVVDDGDYEELSKYKWRALRDHSIKGDSWYAVRSKGKQIIYMHRQILNTPFGKLTDHRNHNGLENCRCNIRICTPAQNQHNRTPDIGTRSKYKGVCWNKRSSKWHAQIRNNYKYNSLGYFDDEINAAKAYDKAAQGLFGEFAYLNFSPTSLL